MRSPEPGPDALAHSRALSRRIAQAARAAGGWLGFDAWMDRALYEPGLGYYAGGASPFGAGGDFVTAPELSPLFAACIATQVSQWFAYAAPTVVEFGAGTGRLAAGVLAELDALGTPARRYAIVEVSGVLRERQRGTIARLAPAALGRVEWLDALPGTIDGVVLGNEVLDAMPVRVFERRGDGIDELGVEADAHDRFQWAARPADASLRDAVEVALAEAGTSVDALPPGYRSEVGMRAAAWVGTVGRALQRGAMLLVDYGFPAREFYHPQRVGGTLIAHRRHRAHVDVLSHPGLQDVTAHVDFTATARAARTAGLELLGYASQARFLVGCGILDRLAREAASDRAGAAEVARVRALGAAQTLLSEAEMGELFKAIAFGRGMPADAVGFVRGDRSAAL